MTVVNDDQKDSDPVTLWEHKNFYLMLKKTHFLVSEKIKLFFLKQKF